MILAMNAAPVRHRRITRSGSAGTVCLGLALAALAGFPVAHGAPTADIVNRSRADAERIRREFEAQKRLIFAEFSALADEVARRRPGIKLALPVPLDRARNVVSHRALPGKDAPVQIFAFADRDFELRSEATAKIDGPGLIDVKAGQKLNVVLMLRNAVADQEDRSFRWCLVRTAQDEEGYIPNTFLRADPHHQAPQKKAGHLYVTSKHGVAVRDQAASDGKLVGRLAHGSEVAVIRAAPITDSIDGVQAYWLYVRKAEMEGWVFGGYLAEAKPPTPIIPSDNRPFVMPVNGGRTSDFGPRIDPITKKSGTFHTGVDIAAATGTPILAALDGTVSQAQRAGGYGLLVVLEHDTTLSTYYGHQSRFAVKAGQRVTRGQLIGYVGSTGRSTGPHLHFEVRSGETTKNPDDYLPQ